MEQLHIERNNNQHLTQRVLELQTSLMHAEQSSSEAIARHAVLERDIAQLIKERAALDSEVEVERAEFQSRSHAHEKELTELRSEVSVLRETVALWQLQKSQTVDQECQVTPVDLDEAAGIVPSPDRSRLSSASSPSPLPRETLTHVPAYVRKLMNRRGSNNTGAVNTNGAAPASAKLTIVGGFAGGAPVDGASSYAGLQRIPEASERKSLIRTAAGSPPRRESWLLSDGQTAEHTDSTVATDAAPEQSPERRHMHLRRLPSPQHPDGGIS